MTTSIQLKNIATLPSEITVEGEMTVSGFAAYNTIAYWQMLLDNLPMTRLLSSDFALRLGLFTYALRIFKCCDRRH